MVSATTPTYPMHKDTIPKTRDSELSISLVSFHVQGEKLSDYKDEPDRTFLGERPELPAAAERDERGASGLEESVEGAAFAAAGLGLSEELLHQRPRSRSTSPPAAEKALDLALRSHSRPSSPEASRDKDDSPRNRRSSMARSTTESPTAVPLHFRRPPTSPGLHRSVPSGGSPTAVTGSPSSSSQTRHRRLNSVEFRNSREIRPLWLVERHGATKGEPVEDDEPLPSLPSSKTSSRAPSVEDLRTLHDEDAVQSWDAVDLGHSMGTRRRPTGLTISTDQANRDEDGDLLDSQQATPTAEDFGPAAGSAKKEKPKYEFHSPSELLQDPAMYPEIPSSPTMEALPSAEGSVVGVKEDVEEDGQERSVDDVPERPVARLEPETPTQERSSFLGDAGPGFAGVVDAAVVAAVKEGEKPIAAGGKELPEAGALPQDESIVTAETSGEPSTASGLKLSGFADVVNAAVAKEVSSQEKAPVDEDLGEPGTAVEEQPPQTLEAVPAEASKDLAPEVTEQSSEPVQEKPTEELVTEEVATTSSSKKKKKKKGKKGSASQSVDLTPSEPAPASEGQAPAVEATEGETRSVEPEAAPATVEQEFTVQTEAKLEAVESSRELDVKPEPAGASESVEAVATIESQPEPVAEQIPAVPAEAEAVSAPELQPEPVASGSADVPAEPKQAEDTAALSKKAKRDKKKQKKKAKSAAAAEEVAQPSDTIASEETPGQSEEKGVEDAQESKDIPPKDELVAAEGLTKNEGSKEIDTAATLAPAEQETSEFQEALEVAEPFEPTSVEDLSKVEGEQVAIETSALDVQEGNLEQAQPPESTEELQTSLELAQPVEEVQPALPSVQAPALEKPEETDGDNFQEAFEEQPVPTEESKEVPSEPSGEVVAEPAAPIEPQESKTEEDQDEQPKKKSKKKKNRKSVSFEEPETPSEPKPTSVSEPEQTKEIEPEQSALAEHADTHVSPAGGETLLSEPEQPVQDGSDLGSAEPVPSQETESVSTPDTEPVASTEPVVSTEESREISVPAADPQPEPEPEPEFPMTAAQKKKAKKEKKKKAKQQSVSSVSEEEKPVESPSTEAQPTDDAQPAESQPVEYQPVEPQLTEEAQSAETQPGESVERQAEPEAASTETKVTKDITSPEEPATDLSAPEEKKKDAAEPEHAPEQAVSIPAVESAIVAAVAEPSQEETKAQEEAPVEEPAAEPEVPMTAAQKKKAKKAKKKQQQQQAALGSVADEAQTTETAAAPEAESTLDPESAPVAEPVDVSKAVEAAPEPEASAAPGEPTASTHDDSLEPSADGPPVSKEVVPSADAPSEAEKKEELLEVEQAKEDGSTQELSVETLAAAEEADGPKDASETVPAEPEAPLTAAQKKKAKKEKKKQQKRQSMQLEEQPSPDSEPAASEQKDTEQITEVSPEAESTAPAEEPSSTAEDMETSEDVAAAVKVSPAEAESEPKAEAAPDEELSQAATTEQKDVAEETPVDPAATTSPEQSTTEEPAPVSTPVATPATGETAPERSQDGPAEEATTVQKSLDETEAPAELAPEAATSEEPTTPVPAEDGTLEETQQPETTPKSKKDKKKKKKRQSLGLEEESQPEPPKEESTEPASAENVEEPASSGEAELAATTEEPPKPEESISETPEQLEPPAPSENAETTTVTEEPSKPEESLTEESPKNETVLAEPVAEIEAAPEPEFQVPMTGAQRKKAKKEKKKRQSLALAEESQPEIQPEAVKEEPQEAAPAENVEAHVSSETAETTTVTEEPSNLEESVTEESPKNETALDQPVVEADAAPEPESEVPMTAARKKKTKKDKKKRKSVSWEDEAVPVPEQEPSVSEQTVDNQDQPVVDGPSQESSKTPTDTEETGKESTTTDVAESTSPVDAPENMPEIAVETEQDSAEAAPSVDAPTEESQDPVATESSMPSDSKKPEAEPLVQAPSDEQSEPVTESKISPEEQPVVAEEPTETAETTEPAAEVALSAKERRKLKKKEKKKGKSVDLTAEAPSTETSQEVEAPQTAELEVEKPDKSQETGSENVETTKEAEPEAPQSLEKDVTESQAIEHDAAVEQKADEQETGAAETLQPTEPDTTKTEIEQAVSEEPLESNNEDVQLSTTETATEPESAPSKDTENQTEQSPEPEPEVALSAKERRKLKKKEKKRQSKNLDADNDAAPKESPSATATEPTEGTTLSETAPTGSVTAAESNIPAPTDNDTRGISEPVTAPSPAEDDGKEHQSHDILPSDAPANDLTSTDEFVSSQVEQPQLESRSSDYPPQPVLERSIDFGDEASGEVQKEVDVEPATPEAEVPSATEEKQVDVEKGDVATEEGESKDVTVQETRPEESGEVVKESPVTEGAPVSEPPVEETSQPTAVEDVSAQQEPAAEEVIQPALSKKQKKKDKKKKQKQLEEKIEEAPVAEPQLPKIEEAEQSEAAPAAPEEIEAKADVELEQVQESMAAPAVEVPPAEQKGHAIEYTDSRPSEAIASPTETKAIDEEPKPVEEQAVVPDTEQVEDPPLSRKLSKKEKKKQRKALLAQQAEPKDKPEEQPVSEAGEAAAPTTEPTDVAAPADAQKDQEVADDSVEAVVQPPDIEVAPEATPVVTEEERPTAEPSTVPPSEEVKIEEPEQAAEPMEDATEEAKPIEAEEPSGEATVEPEEEWPTVSRKKSKKEKQAAAAAAALAIEEDKPAEPQATLDESPNAQEISETPKELPTNDDAQQETIEREQQESVKADVGDRSEPISESVENVIEPPQKVPEAQAEVPEPDSKAEDGAEEAAAPEPVIRKLSKKEKRKAKKQAKQEPLDAVAAPAEETPAENVADLGAEKPAAEDPLTTEGASADVPKETVLETSENTEAASTPQPEQTEAEIPQPDAESKEIEAVVSLDPFDVPSPAEEKEQETSAEPGPNTENVPSQDAQAGVTEELKDETEAKLKARALEKEADLEVAAELFEDRPREQETVVPPSRKLSKKEKRKAKKKGILEESPLEQEQETVLETTAAESKEVEDPTPARQEPEPVPTVEVEAAPELTKDPELVPGAAKEIEFISEPQPAVETDPIPEPEPTVPEAVAEEPESGLSRKASKKKAKKAKKAALALDLGPSPEVASDPQETVTSPADKTPDATRDVERAEPTQQEPKQDDEEWPSIEWEEAKSDKQDPSRDPIPERETVTAVPKTEAIGEFDESAIPEALQEAKQEPKGPVEEESWSVPLSKKDKKKAKKNKRKSEQAALAGAEESAPEPSHKKVELASDVQPESALDPTAPKETEAEPPIRTTTPGGSKIANLFPGLERGGFRRSALKKDSPSLKDSAEEENAADQKVNRELAIPVSEAPLATTEAKDEADTTFQLPTQAEEVTPTTTTTDRDAPVEDASTKDQSIEEPDPPVPSERSIAEGFPSPAHPASKERSSILFGSSPSTRTEEPSTPRHLLPSQMEGAGESPSGLRRTPSVIHGRHQQTARTWSLEEPSLQALRTPSPPRSLFGGPYGEDTHSRPRTPLHPIAEQEPGDNTLSGTPRLEVKPEHVLPRPVTPVRKFTDNALARESWPTSENDSGSGSQDSPKKSPKLNEQGMPILKPSGSKGKLRRTTRSTSGDLRAVSQALDSQPPRSDLDQLPSSSSYDPVTDKGKRPLRNMADVYVSYSL